MNFVDEFWRKDGDVAAGSTSEVVEMVHGGFVAVGVSCQAAGTATIEYSLNPKAANPIWLPMGSVAVGQKAGFSRDYPTQAIRISATTAGCSFTVLQGAG